MENYENYTGLQPQQNVAVVPMKSVARMPEITTVQDLERYASGQVVELPPFAEGQPFVARMRRPSLLSLAKSGKIPNSLLVTANEIFQNGAGGYDSDDKESLKEMFDVMDIIIEASLIQPSYQEIKGTGIELTDDQRLAIFSYSQQGIDALKSFRS